MRTSFAHRGGFALVKSPNHRRQAARRRLLVAGAILALAIAASLIGIFTGPRVEATGVATGPFSYFPHQ